MKNYLLLCVALFMFVFAGCKKDDDKSPSKTDMITGKNWKLTAQTTVETSSAGTTTTDNYVQTPACTQDDIYIFGKDNSFTWDEGAGKCDPSDPQTVATGTWAFTNNESSISITALGSTDESEISELSSSRLVIKSTSVVQGVTSVTTSTYVAQ